MTGVSLFAAAVLNLALPWPSGLPHPVRGLGLLLDALEPRLRALASALAARLNAGPALAEMLAGTLGAALVPLLAGLAAWALASLPVIGFWLGLLLCFAGLALGPLLRAGRAALAALEQAEEILVLEAHPGHPPVSVHPLGHPLDHARRLVGGLVSRDVSRGEAPDLYRALAESLAENVNDAFIAPLFWLVVGECLRPGAGPAFLWAYKAASTMDSMWGYRTERYECFGKAAARLDDALAFLPARLSAVLLRLASLLPFGLTGPGSRWPGFGIIRAEAARMDSPNAGWPMSAAAWLHGAPMGGPTVYHGRVVDKPRLGPDADAGDFDPADPDMAAINPSDMDPETAAVYADRPGPWNEARIRSLLRHILAAGLLGAVLAAVVVALA